MSPSPENFLHDESCVPNTFGSTYVNDEGTQAECYLL